MKRNKDMASLFGRMGDATRGSGRMASKMERVSIATKREWRGLEYGLTEKRLNGLIEYLIYL